MSTATSLAMNRLLNAAKIRSAGAIGIWLDAAIRNQIRVLEPYWQERKLQPDETFAVYLGAQSLAQDRDARERLAVMVGERKARWHLDAIDTEAARLGREQFDSPSNRTRLNGEISDVPDYGGGRGSSTH